MQLMHDIRIKQIIPRRDTNIIKINYIASEKRDASVGLQFYDDII